MSTNGKVAYSAAAPGIAGQIFNPLTYLTTSSGQYGLVNIRYGESSNPQTEQAIVENVAGYGKQLGRLVDAVDALTGYLGEKDHDIAKMVAIQQLRELALDIAKAKADSAAESMPLSGFISSLEGLKKSNPRVFAEVKAKLEAVLQT